MANWTLKDLDNWTDLSVIPNVIKLNISNNKLTEIPLKVFKLINLQELVCYNNTLSNLPCEIQQLVNLKILICTDNKLKKLPKEIGQLINLFALYCGKNEIDELPKEIGQLINLQEFICFNNKLTRLPKEIGQLINLRLLHLCANNLTHLPNEIEQLINLQHFDYSNNPITYIPPNINRILNRIKNHQNIYKDQQNVHNHEIQNCIKQSINNIIQIKPSINNLETFILENELLNDKTKSLLFDYILNEDLFNNITFKELLLVVLTIIETKENKNDIYKILNQEINDAECYCLTGRISRLINILNGQDDRIIINISDKEQIGNIIVLIKNNLENDYTIEKHKELVIKELKERGFNEEIINEYVNYIE
jgi:Leucine-rich repeat (LRR) protein